MALNRRGFLGGLLAAPAIIRTPGLLMPVRPLEAFEFSGFHSSIPLGQIAGVNLISDALRFVTENAGGEEPSHFIMNPRDFRSLVGRRAYRRIVRDTLCA